MKVNLRSRMLCCENFDDFVLGYSSGYGLPRDLYADDEAVHCRPLGAMLETSKSLRETLQILYICRLKKCPPAHPTNGEPLGVVVEFGVESGVDGLAIYFDGHGSWFESKTNSMLEFAIAADSEAPYDAIRSAVHRARDKAIPDPVNVPPPPAPGHMLVSLLSDRGIAFAQGLSRDLATDNLTGPIVHAALAMRKKVFA